MKETSCKRLEVLVRIEGETINLKEVLLKMEDEQSTIKELPIPLKSEEQDVFEGRYLADVVEIGNYVNYPVEYENVDVYNRKSSLKGWRVISKDTDLDGNIAKGTVNLVSAGVPLTFQHLYNANAPKSVKALTTNFLLTEFVQVVSGKAGYVKNGFNSSRLSEVFNNRYTTVVRAMKPTDFSRRCGIPEDECDDLIFIKDEQGYGDFVAYWLAFAGYSQCDLWYVSGGGNVYGIGSLSEYGVRPVVSLKSEVLADGKDETGAWNIRV